MKKAVFSLFSFFLLFLLVKQSSFATVYKSGSSTSSIKVEAEGNSEVNVQSTSNTTSSNTNTQSTHTYIEINNNGEKKVLEKDGPGEFKLESNLNGGKTSVSVNQTGDDISPTKISTKSAEENDKDADDKKEKIEEKNIIKSFFENIKNFFFRIFANL